MIGYFHVNDYVPDDEEFRAMKCIGVGIVIGKGYQGNGFGTEALTFLTEHLLKHYDICFADHFKENLPSKIMIENSGYSYLEDYSIYFEEFGREIICSSYYRKRLDVKR
ncbi:MAG: GNAT family N-acetyltransferase [Clostridia bacterium]|nr:GNAT family N-acetyltransferase [Clostridia bacterium]